MRRLGFWCVMGLAAACGSSDLGMASVAAEADLGATPGGQQDIGAARQMLNRGSLPSREMLTYAGIFSEHDLGFANPEPCLSGQTLCVEARVGTVDLIGVEGTSETLVQIGFDTGIETPFERKPLNLSLAVDVSGSMSGDRIGATRDALRSLVDSLNDDDVFSLVTFNNEATVLIGPTAGSEKQRLRDAVDRLQAGGGTNIGAGLDASFEQLRLNLTEENRTTTLHRAMLFTDMHPNQGVRDGRSFVRILEEAADDGIGVSSFGVGIDFGADLANQVSQVRGGNYFHLETPEKIRRVFERDFDLMVTPLAYDLEISLLAPAGYEIVDAYGLAGAGTGRCDGQPAGRCIGLTVPTVFLSRGGGGMFLRLALEAGADQPGDPIFFGHVVYQDEAGQSVEHESGVSLAPQDVPALEETEPSIRMAAQLINVIDALQQLVDRSADETFAWSVIDAVRSEVEAMGGRADSLLRELVLIYQAVEIVRQRR
ncbi:MAG: VWA domain-containing protein [Myxococcota bacterium]|nr:VWA domain-containing protein [Myxococcota bacterium]